MMTEPLTKEETKQVAKEAMIEFLKQQKGEFQKTIGGFVIRWAIIISLLSLFHLTMHGRYQKFADFLVDSITQ